MFATIFSQLIPLYFCILLGFIAGRWLGVDRHSVAAMVFYLLLPMVILSGVMQTTITIGVLLLPVVLFFISCGLCGVMYYCAGLKWRDSRRNILALSAGNGNTGYFGLPVAMMILPPEQAGIYVMALLGVTLYENSLGYFITARGQHTAKESLNKIIKLPSLYAFLLGLLLNFCTIKIPDVITPFVGHVRGAYSILGMMMIGLGLATIERLRFDIAFIGVAFLAKFIVWPFVALGLIYLDTHWLHLFSQPIHHALFIISIVPMAANTVVIATLLKSEPEKIAMAVLLSTLVALISVPIMLSLYL